MRDAREYVANTYCANQYPTIYGNCPMAMDCNSTNSEYHWKFASDKLYLNHSNSVGYDNTINMRKRFYKITDFLLEAFIPMLHFP